MRIGSRLIGNASECFVITEIGVNHDGSVQRAKDLIAAAAAAKADAVKFQYFRAEHLLSNQARLAAYQQANGASDPFTMLQQLELPADAVADLIPFTRSLGLEPIVTVFSLEDVQTMGRLDWAAFKIASPDIVNRPLIESVVSLGRPVVLSTGAACHDEVQEALGWIRSIVQGDLAERLALMQCISCYPTPADQAHLTAIATLRRSFNVQVGYSDHTTEECTGALAVAAGATFVEKHLTYDCRACGPDHAMSLDPPHFKRYVQLVRLATAMRGESRKIVHGVEQDVRSVSRQSIAAARTLLPGATITRRDLTIRRPGTGLEPRRLNEFIGGVVVRKVEANEMLREDDVSRTPAGAGLAIQIA